MLFDWWQRIIRYEDDDFYFIFIITPEYIDQSINVPNHIFQMKYWWDLAFTSLKSRAISIAPLLQQVWCGGAVGRRP